MAINLLDFVYDQDGVAKVGLTVEFWHHDGVAAVTSATTSSTGQYSITALDITKSWRTKIIDGDKVLWIEGRGKHQLAELDLTGFVNVDTINEHTAASGVTIDGVLLKDGSIDMLTHQIIGITNLVGNAATASLYIKSNVTAGAPAQRDIYIQTGNASNPQTLGNRMLFMSNGADGAVGIRSYEPIVLDHDTAMTLVADQAGAKPASAQIYSTAPGTFDLATGQGNNLAPVRRLTISNATTAVATWVAVTHTNIKLTGAASAFGAIVLPTGAGKTVDQVITELQNLGLVTQA